MSDEDDLERVELEYRAALIGARLTGAERTLAVCSAMVPELELEIERADDPRVKASLVEALTNVHLAVDSLVQESDKYELSEAAKLWAQLLRERYASE